MRGVEIGALNIVMPEPHGPERYISLLRDAYRTKRVIKVRGEFAAILGGFGSPEMDDFVGGEVYKFFNLDISSRWINVEQQAPAEADELNLIRVPDNLKPGLQAFPFLFHPKRHRLFFLSRDRDEHVGPTDAMRYFRELLNQPRLVQRYGKIEVTVEPERDSLDKIFGMSELRRLDIELSPPNPDDLEEYETAVKQRMRKQNAQRLQMTLVAERGGSIQPDDDTKALSRVAQSNGHVTGRGRIGDGPVVDVSTQQHPLLSKETYDPDVDTPLAAVLRAANAFIRKIRNRPAQPQ
jgi:hypothetical protein